MACWCEDKKISWHFIQPGCPIQNAYTERKNGSMRRELLNAYAFDSLKEAGEQCAVYRQDYNEERPHESLGYLSPVLYAAKHRKGSEAKVDERSTALSTNARRPAPPEQTGRVARTCG